MLKREASRQPARRPLEPPTAFHFKATPMPTATPFRPVLPHRVVTATPFQLATESRPQQRQVSTRSETESRPAFQFKAQPWNADDFARPLEIPRPHKPLTEVQAFNFRCDQRASVRATWEEERRQKERAKEGALAQREKERQEKEAEELKALRKSLVHQPLPIGIKKYKLCVSSSASASGDRHLASASESQFAPGARPPLAPTQSSPLRTMR